MLFPEPLFCTALLFPEIHSISEKFRVFTYYEIAVIGKKFFATSFVICMKTIQLSYYSSLISITPFRLKTNKIYTFPALSSISAFVGCTLAKNLVD